MLLNLVAEQLRMGIHAEIASIGAKGLHEKPIEQAARARGFPVSVFRMRPGLNLLGALKIRNYATDKNFDIFHSHGYKGNILLGLLPGKIRCIPLVSTLHGYTSTRQVSKMRIYECLDIAVLPLMDEVILVSESMRNSPRLKRITKNNFRVIHNGIPPIADWGAPIDANQRHSIQKFCESGFIIGAVGRLSPEKGFLNLIEAFDIISKSIPDSKLVIIGEGALRSKLERKAESLGLKERILLPGYVSNAAYYMRFFNVFTISSITEGLPITLLEAMQRGIPAVCTNVGGIANVLRHEQNGLLVEPSDPAALSAAVERLFRESLLCEAICRQAKNDVTENYSSKRMALDYGELYKVVLRKSIKTG